MGRRDTNMENRLEAQILLPRRDSSSPRRRQLSPTSTYP
jgi:hypothetical protein